MLLIIFTILCSILNVKYFCIVDIAPDAGSSATCRVPHGLSQRNCELQCISHGLMHITYSETCVNVNDGNAGTSQELTTLFDWSVARWRKVVA